MLKTLDQVKNVYHYVKDGINYRLTVRHDSYLKSQIYTGTLERLPTHGKGVSATRMTPMTWCTLGYSPEEVVKRVDEFLEELES